MSSNKVRMLEESNIQAIVFRAIDRVNELLIEEQALPREQCTVLLGERAALDSMGFVNFLVALEEEFTSATGGHLNLTESLNAEATSGAVSTVGDLIGFIKGISAK